MLFYRRSVMNGKEKTSENIYKKIIRKESNNNSKLFLGKKNYKLKQLLGGSGFCPSKFSFLNGIQIISQGVFHVNFKAMVTIVYKMHVQTNSLSNGSARLFCIYINGRFYLKIDLESGRESNATA